MVWYGAEGFFVLPVGVWIDLKATAKSLPIYWLFSDILSSEKNQNREIDAVSPQAKTRENVAAPVEPC